MIQDFKPKKYEPLYKNIKPCNDDYILCFKNGLVYLINDEIPKISDLKREVSSRYLFSLNDKKYFMSLNELDCRYQDINIYRRFFGGKGYIIMTAYHMYLWYRRNNYCGVCGKALVHSEHERAFICPDCNMLYFPKISPFVIVLIKNTKDDTIVVTKYKKGYSRFALVAGFIEIGETPEEAVIREVKEEVGLDICNIKYYGSQPWGISGGLALGYTCEIKGDSKITLEEDELSIAKFLRRDDNETEVSDEMSLTGTMIKDFRLGKI